MNFSEKKFFTEMKEIGADFATGRYTPKVLLRMRWSLLKSKFVIRYQMIDACFLRKGSEDILFPSICSL
jgi:hypothetical protein